MTWLNVSFIVLPYYIHSEKTLSSWFVFSLTNIFLWSFCASIDSFLYTFILCIHWLYSIHLYFIANVYYKTHCAFCFIVLLYYIHSGKPFCSSSWFVFKPKHIQELPWKGLDPPEDLPGISFSGHCEINY